MNVRPKFEVRSFTVTLSWDNSDWSFGWGLRTPNLGEEEAIGGRGWYCSKEHWWVPIGPPIHSNFSSIFTRFRDIAAFVLQHTTFSHPISIVSPKFPRVPLGVGGWPLGYEERRCGAIVGLSVQLVSKIANLCSPRQTDGRHAITCHMRLHGVMHYYTYYM